MEQELEQIKLAEFKELSQEKAPAIEEVPIPKVVQATPVIEKPTPIPTPPVVEQKSEPIT